MNVYEIVTEKILAKLEEGTIPWRIPWNSKEGAAVNWKSQKPYRGINCMLLDPGEYASYKQVTEAGGTVKKGQKGNLVVFWKWLKKENEETGKMEDIPYLRYYTVFEINTQCEGLKSRRKDTAEPIYHDPIVKAEVIISGYENGPQVEYKLGRACYSPAIDKITIPPIFDYNKPEEYYSTRFHESIHSTGHKNRLNRKGITELTGFGTDNYSKEELIAEIGAAMLCSLAGIENATIENSAAYIKSWHRKLKEEPRWIVYAASQAQKAADHILGTQEAAEEPESLEKAE